MTRRAWFGVGLAALVIASAVGLFLLLFEKTSTQVNLPPTGEAAINPLYALRNTLRAHGQVAQTRRWLHLADQPPGPRDTLVLFGQAAPFSAADARRVLDWVRGGGHLVMRSEGVVASDALRDLLGVRIAAGEFDCFDVAVETDASAPAMPAPARARRKVFADDDGSDDDDDADGDPVDTKGLRDDNTMTLCGAGIASATGDVVLASPGAHAAHRFARLRLGAGQVSLLPDLDFLGNEALQAPVATELAYQLLAPGFGRGGFVLVYGREMPSLLRLLVEHAWQVLVPLLLALAAWLALRAQRFGSLQVRASGDRRALLEHVQAAGEFAFRRGRGRALHTALLERFERRLARRDPLLAALADDARVLALAERFQLPASRVRQALFPGDLQRPDAFLQSISTLVQMRLSL